MRNALPGQHAVAAVPRPATLRQLSGRAGGSPRGVSVRGLPRGTFRPGAPPQHPEVRAFEQVLLAAAQGVVERDTGGARLLDLLVELGDLPPTSSRHAAGDSARDVIRVLVSASENPTSRRDRITPTTSTAEGGVAPLARHPPGGHQQAEFLIVAKGGGGEPGSSGQLADRQKLIGHLDFKRT